MLDLLYTAVRQRIAAVWPEVALAPDGVTRLPILEADHADRIPWEDLTPPYAVIAIASAPKDDQYSPVNVVAFLPQVQIYYVAETEGPQSPIRAKLEALFFDLMSDSLSLSPPGFGQVMRFDEMTWGSEIEANVVMAAKNMTHRAGRLTVSVLYGANFNVGES